jgi:hypothetical protein
LAAIAAYLPHEGFANNDSKELNTFSRSDFSPLPVQTAETASDLRHEWAADKIAALFTYHLTKRCLIVSA